MREKILRHLWWATFALAAILLAAHTFGLGTVSVDSTSILLLVLMLVSPFVSTIRKVKWGDFEAEIDPKEVKRLRETAEAGLAQATAPPESVPEIRRTVAAILELGQEDKVLALAKLRIELEKILRRLGRALGIETTNRPNLLATIIHRLGAQEAIPQEMAGSLREVVAICNRAVHGESISDESATSILGVGADLLESLYWQSKEFIDGRVITEEIISSDEVDRRQNARYRLTTVVPLVNEPKLLVREVTQEQLEEYLEGYYEFAEFIVGLEEITS